MNELKPCPFCGAMPNLNKYLDTLGRLKWGIICENSNGKCEIEPMTAWYADKDECIEAWNKRVNRCEDCLIDNMIDDGR